LKTTFTTHSACLRSRPKAGSPWLPLLLLATFAIHCSAQDQVPAKPDGEGGKEAEPTCIFSGIVWQGASINGLGYFPEGKEEDEFIEVFLPNAGRSRKYAYYGASTLTFYNRIEVEEEGEGKPEDAKPPPKKESATFIRNRICVALCIYVLVRKPSR